MPLLLLADRLLQNRNRFSCGARLLSQPLFALQVSIAALTLALTLPTWATPASADFSSNDPRQVLSLGGAWEFHRDPASAGPWKTVQVPCSFQSHEGTDFHGVGWYRKRLAVPALPVGRRALLQFQAAATEAQIWFDDHLLGSHLGGWTPFRFDLTDLLRDAPPGATHEIRMRLDEKVGHNTQGFLPIIAPHFGGLWQSVSLLMVPETYIDDWQMLVVGEPATQTLRVELPLVGTQAVSNLLVRCRLCGSASWDELTATVTCSNHLLLARAPLAAPRLWSPAEPNLYEVELALPGAEGDRVRARAAFRTFDTAGPEFRLNGKPVALRGLLNWGYSAPRVEPNPGEAVWRSELEFARTNGFNLMKFCLWVPPQRYLELADEMGVLTWLEYPTWHPDFSAKFLQPLQQEFSEFFHYDRNHASVFLRSLTCETGPSADLQVIRSLYDEAHTLIPGALVEDDSSWIEWNRVHDFYDDHPYGNNHTWVKTLNGFNEYILGHGLKPLVLGETTSADTWLDSPALLARLGSERPWWSPGPLDDSARWMEQMRALCGDNAGLESLRADSLRYGLLMRKYQMEAFRREVPYGGYVISVLRDIPTCSMGLLDYLGRPKWSPDDWQWQRDTMCLLKTDHDRRSFVAGQSFQGELLLSHFGTKPLRQGRLTLTLENDAPGAAPLETLTITNVEQNPGTLAQVAELNWPLPKVSVPQRLMVKALLQSSEGEFRNEWPIWVVPEVSPNALRGIQVHASLSPALLAELFPDCPTFTSAGAGARGSADFQSAVSQTSQSAGAAARAQVGNLRYSRLETRATTNSPSPIVVASRFDDDLVRFLEHGGRVLLLPDGQEHSFALNAHWFLRGAPFIHAHPLAGVPHDFLLELQHFDLAADVIPQLACFESWDPVLYLWDTHDQKRVLTHAVIAETRAGSGRLLVSAAHHTGADNAAGRYLLAALLDHLRAAVPPQHALPEPAWAYLKTKLHAEQTNLVARTWLFKPDTNSVGLDQGWHRPDLASEADWKPIRIGSWWESQGYPTLDGWAWYRLWVDVPRTWQGREIYLSFTGVDDMYELYVNGQAAGKGGDLATHKDALDERVSHNISRFVHPGSRALIAVRVYDWYGAGGIFRPVTLGTLPLNPELDLLK